MLFYKSVETTQICNLSTLVEMVVVQHVYVQLFHKLRRNVHENEHLMTFKIILFQEFGIWKVEQDSYGVGFSHFLKLINILQTNFSLQLDAHKHYFIEAIINSISRHHMKLADKRNRHLRRDNFLSLESSCQVQFQHVVRHILM